jgi:hypothetical protein
VPKVLEHWVQAFRAVHWVRLSSFPYPLASPPAVPPSFVALPLSGTALPLRSVLLLTRKPVNIIPFPATEATTPLTPAEPAGRNTAALSPARSLSAAPPPPTSTSPLPDSGGSTSSTSRDCVGEQSDAYAPQPKCARRTTGRSEDGRGAVQEVRRRWVDDGAVFHRRGAYSPPSPACSPLLTPPASNRSHATCVMERVESSCERRKTNEGEKGEHRFEQFPNS